VSLWCREAIAQSSGLRRFTYAWRLHFPRLPPLRTNSAERARLSTEALHSVSSNTSSSRLTFARQSYSSFRRPASRPHRQSDPLGNRSLRSSAVHLVPCTHLHDHVEHRRALSVSSRMSPSLQAGCGGASHQSNDTRFTAAHGLRCRSLVVLPHGRQTSPLLSRRYQYFLVRAASTASKR
jgi:hypothetical protein